MANKYMKKMVNIFTHKGNANQNYTEIQSYLGQIGNHQ
jgi:hypothetical protein